MTFRVLLHDVRLTEPCELVLVRDCVSVGYC
jgi:hypothetical protein